MDPLVTSSLISAGSNLLGGLFGGGSNNKQRSRALEDQYDMTRRYALEQPSWIAEGAKRAGFHPLAALNMSPAQAPAITVGGNDYGAAEAVKDMGQGISRAAGAYASREDRQLVLASAKLDLENKQLQNERLRSENRLMTAPGTPAVGDQFSPIELDPMLSAGISNKSHPLFRTAVDQKGAPLRVYNDDLGDNEVLQAMTALGYTVPDYIYNNFTKPAAKWLRRGARHYFGRR